MQKRMKRLHLHSETLLQLDRHDLEQVGGGATNGTLCLYTGCIGSCNATCSVYETCTTKYC